MWIAERLWPGRRWPKTRRWWLRALTLNAVQAGSVYLAGLSLDPWLTSVRFFELEKLGVFAQALLGYIVHTFVYYGWHRARHASPFLWRWFHQIHHSPQRIEMITSFYKHPLEILANGLLSSVILYLVLGLSAQAAALTMLVNGLAEFFYHWNIRTPHWIGPFIQRPESHCVHHQSGLHAYNYADLPIFDMLFGTYLNPKSWHEQCGFEGEQENQLGPMLLGKNLDDRPKDQNP